MNVDIHAYKIKLQNINNVTYQMNSRQCEQNVGWRKNVAINLWPLTYHNENNDFNDRFQDYLVCWDLLNDLGQ